MQKRSNPETSFVLGASEGEATRGFVKFAADTVNRFNGR